MVDLIPEWESKYVGLMHMEVTAASTWVVRQVVYECHLLQALMELADVVLHHRKAGSLGAFSGAIADLAPLVGRLQWQAALYAERCYWALCQSTQQKLSGRNLNVKVCGAANPLPSNQKA
jgi:hypothetical protein